MPMLTTRGGRLFYDTAGAEGPRVLLIQGVGALGEGWRPQIAALAGDHRLAWLDNRGIGQSDGHSGEVSIQAMAEDCLDLMDHLGWERAHIVGHSMGGIIAQHIGLTAPARARSLALLSTLRRGRDVLLRPSLPVLRASLGMRVGPERARWLAFCALSFPRAYREAAGPDALLELIRPVFCRDLVASPPIMRRQALALWSHTGAASLGALAAIPTLILTGALDQVIPTAHSDDLARRIPGARLERIAEAGHGAPLQCPAEVSRLLREHIARAEGWA